MVKNKVAPPFREAEFDIMFGEGISKEGEIVDYGIKLDIIDKSGAWISYGDKKLGQGRENAKVFLKENSDVSLEIENKIKEFLGTQDEIMPLTEDDESSDKSLNEQN